jgi:hypothetical protein
MLDGLRGAVARHARDLGFDVTELRVADRADVVEQLLDGTAAPKAIDRLAGTRLDLATRVAMSAPRWLASYGGGLEARLTTAERATGDAPSARDAGAFSSAPAQSGRGLAGLVDAVAARDVFRDRGEAQRALARFEAMRRENASFAQWCLKHQPAVFGVTGPGAVGLARDERFARSLRAYMGSAAEAPQPRRTARPEGAYRAPNPVSPERLQRSLLRISGDRLRLASGLERAFPGSAEHAADAATLREQAGRIRAQAEGLPGAPPAGSAGNRSPAGSAGNRSPSPAGVAGNKTAAGDAGGKAGKPRDREVDRGR